MKHSKVTTSIIGTASNSPTEAVEAIKPVQATLVCPEEVNDVQTSTGSLESIVNILPRLNKHFSKQSLEVIQKALTQYSDKVDKIILYANSVDESQLPLIFSVPTF